MLLLINYEFTNDKDEIISGAFEWMDKDGSLPDLEDAPEKLFNLLLADSFQDELVELRDYHCISANSVFKDMLRLKGYNMVSAARSFGVTPRQMTNIAKNPTRKDMLALKGLPIVETGRMEAGGFTNIVKDVMDKHGIQRAV